MLPQPIRIIISACFFLLLLATLGAAQTTRTVSTDAELRTALSAAQPGDTILFSANIRVTQELPSIASDLTINGAGHTLSGDSQFRGFIVVNTSVAAGVPINVAFQDLTIANTVATGGAGGSGPGGGGGGGAGAGGAIFVGDLATVTVSNVHVVSSSATGGSGGTVSGASGGGGGGGLGGNGGSGIGGGGGVGLSAFGSSNGTVPGAGILTGALSGGNSGGLNGGGGASTIDGGGGGGVAGGPSVSGFGGIGGFGGGGGGGASGGAGISFGASGGFGGGGGGGINGAGSSFFGGGGGGTTLGSAALGGFGGGAGSTIGGGGGGAALGGAIFVQGGGSLTVVGPFTLNGSSVTAGLGGAGAENGAAQAAGIFLDGSGSLSFVPAVGETIVIGDAIADLEGLGVIDAGFWTVVKNGAGTLVLSGVNAYAGGTQVNAGTLSVSRDANLGVGGATVSLTGTSTLAITGSDTFTRGLFLQGAPTISVSSGATATWADFVSDLNIAGSLTVAGGGTLALTNNTNSYSGGTFVIGGSTILVSDDGALGAPGAGVTLGDASSGGTLGFLTGTSVVSTRDFTLGGTIGGTFDVQGTSLATLAGALSGSGRLTKTGTGTLFLPTPTTHAGGTSINGGTLSAGAANLFAAGTGVSVAAGATFDLNSFSQTLGSVSGAGSIALGSATLTTGGANTSTSFSGIISGTGALVKTGTGTLTLSGANTYTGGTIVTGGTLFGSTTSLQGNILNNAAVTFGQGSAGTYAGSMSGTGSLTLSGGGAVTLSGANTYTGGTTISGSTLIGTTTSLHGSIFNNGGITFNQGSAGTYAGSMSGTGSLTLSGGGTLTLSGANTYSGATTITGGVLQAGAANAFSANSPISIGAGSTLNLNGFSHTLNLLAGSGNIALGSATLTTGTDGGSTVLAASISGSGSLVKDGQGTLTLSGANSYTGGTTVLGGALVGTTSSLQGNIFNNVLVVFDQGVNGTYAGSMSGSGALQKTGGGILTVTGHSTYTGGTFITGGSLIGTGANLHGSIVNNASLTFGGAGDDLFAGTLSGTGLLTKTGSGTLTLTGAHQFSGQTSVSQGTLVLDGTLGGGVNVAAGAAFRVHGVVFGSVNVDGLLAAIPSLGSVALTGAAGGGPASKATSGDRLAGDPLLTIGGNLFAGPGSVLSVPIGPGSTPSILVGGTATLNGTELDVVAPDLGTQRRLSFLALTALKGLSVTNTVVATGNPLLVPALKQTATSLFVTLLNMGVPLSRLARSGNAAAAGAAIDGMKGDLTGDRGFVIRELMALDDNQVDDALRQIAGELHASSRHLAVRGSEAFTDMIRNQITERDHEAEDEPGWGGKTVRWWGQLSREHTSFQPRDGAFGGGMDITDGAAGFDMRLSDRWLVGGGGGFGQGQLGLDGFGGSSDVSTPRAFGVVGFKPKGFGIRGGGSISRSKAKSSRAILIIATLPPELGGDPLTGGIDRTAASDDITVQSDQWSEYADHQDMHTYRLDYMLGVRRARFARNSFIESGAGALSLQVPDETLNLTEADVKVHLWRRKGGTRPYFETLFRRSSPWPVQTTVRFAEQKDSDFKTAGLPLGQNAVAGRAGVMFVRLFGTLTVEYRFRKAAGQTVHAADVRYRF